MKKCLILLAVLMMVIVVSMVAEREDVELPENTIAINDAKDEYSAFDD